MKTTLFAILLFMASKPLGFQLYDSDSPDSLLYGLLGLLLIGVIHVANAVRQAQKETSIKAF